MRLVAHALQQLQRAAVEAKPQRRTFAGPVDFLELLGQADHRHVLEAELGQLAARHAKLPFAAVDQNQVRHRARLALEPAVAPPHRLGHAGKVVLRQDALHAEPPVLRAVRFAAQETDHRCDHERAAYVRDVEPLDALGRRVEPKCLAKRGEVASGIDRARQLHRHAGELARLAGGLAQIADHIAVARGFFVVERLGGILHLRIEFLFPLAGLALEIVARLVDLLPVLIERHLADARRGAVLQVAVEAMLVVALGWVERTAAAEVEFFAEHRDRPPTRPAADERPEIFRAVLLPQPREGEARDRVVEVHLDEQEILVVAKADVVARLEFFD